MGPAPSRSRPPTVTDVPRTKPAGTGAPRAARRGNGRPADAARTPPTLATQLNNGDIAGRWQLLARRSRSLPPPARGAAGSRGWARGAAGREHAFARGGGGGFLPARPCPERSRPQDGPAQKGKWVGRARGRGGRARPTPPPPRPPRSSARRGKVGGAGGLPARGGLPAPGRPARSSFGRRSPNPDDWGRGFLELQGVCFAQLSEN